MPPHHDIVGRLTLVLVGEDAGELDVALLINGGAGAEIDVEDLLGIVAASVVLVDEEVGGNEASTDDASAEGIELSMMIGLAISPTNSSASISVGTRRL